MIEAAASRRIIAMILVSHTPTMVAVLSIEENPDVAE
jgi:hypothetical protein